MRAADIIAKKRDGNTLSAQEIDWFIERYTAEQIPDYQAAALLMAIYLKGMEREETYNLTMALVRSGDQIDLSDISGYAVDKHSSGGVGDKTTLVVLPMVAALQIPIAKMSGRGLGFTGGTLDKLDSIPGYNVELSNEQVKRQARDIGVVLTGQSQELAPADGKLYALRDVTATVSSLPLIASSIMSKKIAGGANGIVLDVKVGEGAFMRELDNARELARIMVQIGSDAGRDVIAVISDMNQPLGQAIGNAIELREAVETLRGGGPAQFREHCLEIAKHMVMLAGQGETWDDPQQVHQALAQTLEDGTAFDRFRQMVAAQGGDVSVIDDLTQLPSAPVQHTLKAERAGYISRLGAGRIGIAAMQLGAGRERKGDPIDHAVGLRVHVRVGDRVTPDTPLFTIHANHTDQIDPCLEILRSAIEYSDEPVQPLPSFYDVIKSGG